MPAKLELLPTTHARGPNGNTPDLYRYASHSLGVACPPHRRDFTAKSSYKCHRSPRFLSYRVRSTYSSCLHSPCRTSRMNIHDARHHERCILLFHTLQPVISSDSRAVFDGGLGVEPPAKISDPPAAIKKTQGGRLSMYLCISTVVDFNSQNFDAP